MENIITGSTVEVDLSQGCPNLLGYVSCYGSPIQFVIGFFGQLFSEAQWTTCIAVIYGFDIDDSYLISGDHVVRIGI
jgi:hypothetical protein